jgi:GNAT superfamily N-acetyltransferase
VTRSWTDDELRRRHRTTQRRFSELVAQASPDARLVELGDVRACLVPSLPDRSFPNAVTYDRADELTAALPALAALYADAGVRAWTVWVPHDDDAAREALGKAGHVLDAAPTEMGAPLSEVDLEPRQELDLDPVAAFREIVAINERAYARPDAFSPGFAGFPIEHAHVYVARWADVPAACVVAIDERDDCGIELAATVPEAQGNGLCSELIRLALRDARTRGCETTTLEGTAAGAPVYRRLGYRDLGALEMWERRVSG